MSQIKSKGASAVIIFVAVIVSIVGLIMYGGYIGSGGDMNPTILVLLIVGILLEISLFVLSGDLSDLVAMAVPVLLVIGTGLELGDGIGNIADWASGIICYGNPDLAESNLAITGVLLFGVLVSVIVCFMRRERRQETK